MLRFTKRFAWHLSTAVPTLECFAVLPNIMDELQAFPHAIHQLAEACSLVASPQSVVRHFSLANHPSIQQQLARQDQTRCRRDLSPTIVADVFCHADEHSMFIPPPVPAQQVVDEHLLADSADDEAVHGIELQDSDGPCAGEVAAADPELHQLLHHHGVQYLQDGARVSVLLS